MLNFFDRLLLKPQEQGQSTAGNPTYKRPLYHLPKCWVHQKCWEDSLHTEEMHLCSVVICLPLVPLRELDALAAKTDVGLGPPAHPRLQIRNGEVVWRAQQRLLSHPALGTVRV